MAAIRHTLSDDMAGSRRGIGPRAAALIAGVLSLLLLAACAGDTPPEAESDSHGGMSTATKQPAQAASMTMSDHGTVAEFTLKTGMNNGNMVFVGSGGDIEGVVNPELHVGEGDIVKITLVNGDAAEHDIAFPDFNAHSDHLWGRGSTTTFQFTAAKRGEYVYYCTVAGHRKAGMEGKFIVGGGQTTTEETDSSVADIVRKPDDLPARITRHEPQTVRVSMETVEVQGRLADGTLFNYWTFDGKVPGPMVRVRVGDTVELTLKNNASSRMSHSIDLHAVTGPGGGATVTQVPPGEQRTFTFKALHAGLFVYHCATPLIASHISAGMYGMILVEPEDGLPPVDHEFYVMQGEIYTVEPFGAKGLLQLSDEKVVAERPEYFVFNGSVGALTDLYPMRAKVGDTVRIYFGVGGPNATSSFHMIGEVFDRAYPLASLTSPPLTDVQTLSVPPGGAAVVEMELQVPGKYIMVDHALARAERGLMGWLLVEGPENPGVFHDGAEGER
jgi:nitrite reductase (NO-forming)